ncbi:MAG: V-type ATP synthase subunit E [Lachnospiraceae bacterium]|nr:V-type ATP synthase subunit E [Lachnospiraceae bacterium]
MTVDERIKHLRVKAMEEARSEANAIIKQHEDALRQLAKQHEEEVKRQMETRIKAEEVSAKQQLNMAMSKAQLELKREIGATQFELKKELFQEVEEKLNAYMQTPEYKKLLVTYIEKAAGFSSGEEMTIYINPSDERWKEYLEEHTGMKLTVSKEDFVGGVRAVIHERNILIDYAFKGALENESRKFSFKGGAGID